MKFQINHYFLITVLTIFIIFSKSNAKLVSFQSEYEISNYKKKKLEFLEKHILIKQVGIFLLTG